MNSEPKRRLRDRYSSWGSRPAQKKGMEQDLGRRGESSKRQVATVCRRPRGNHRTSVRVGTPSQT